LVIKLTSIDGVEQTTGGYSIIEDVNVKPHGVHFTDRDMTKNEYYGDLKFSLNNPQYDS
jgi:hypothetical protein